MGEPRMNDAIDGLGPAGPLSKGERSGRMVAALLIPMPIAGLVTFLATNVFREYGWSLFFGLPFVTPMLSVILYGYGRRPTWVECLKVGWYWLLLAILLLLVTAFEGVICILMALPLAIPAALLGASIGYLILGRGSLGARDLGRMTAALLAALPAMVGAEHLADPEPPLFACRTSVDIDAPPDQVWRRVVSFPDLAPPGDFLFRAGVAYPVRARIEGNGEGAVRYCEFSTGAFEEPIEIWDEPRLLRFSVTSCPPPMREWNPFFEIHPPHLTGFLVSEKGQFLLIELPRGGTRLEGTTWYRHGLWPASYWRVWSDAIIHRIHTRVLGHIKILAEG
jgi:hypothetical protein